nr:DUF559 domain-containing protein [Virgibacillus phasianinus]
MDTFGMLAFLLIFIVIPLYYTISLIRDPSPVSVEVPVDYERMKCESPIEYRLYDALTFRGHDVKTQVPCGKYRIDLTLPVFNLAIECDGKAFHSTPAQKAHDRRKNNYLRKHGWSVLRFSGSRINKSMPKVISAIEEKINTD